MISGIPIEMLWLVAVFIMLMAGFLAAAEELKDRARAV